MRVHLSCVAFRVKGRHQGSSPRNVRLEPLSRPLRGLVAESLTTVDSQLKSWPGGSRALVERMTTLRWATTPRGDMANPGKRWLAMLAALVLVAGLGHVWLHYSGAVGADHFGQNAVDDCLQCELPLVASAAAATGLLLPVLFIAVGTARVVAPAPYHQGPPARAPPPS